MVTGDLTDTSPMLTRSDRRRLTGVAVGIWLLLLSGVTCVRAQAWTSDLTLWTAAVAVTPQKPRPFINLGLAWDQAGQLPQAMQAWQTAYALAFQPRLTAYQQTFSQVASLTNIARVLAQHGQEPAAERLLTAVVARVPQFPHAQHNLAVLYARTGRCRDGLPHSEIAARLDASFQVMVCP